MAAILATTVGNPMNLDTACPSLYQFLQSQSSFALDTKESGQKFVSDVLDAFHKDGPLCGHQFYTDSIRRGLQEDLGEQSRGTAIALVILCLVCAGLASGLTQGLLSLDLMEMKIISRSGTDKEKLHASKVLPLLSNHHLLLVTLMLWNATCTEALPIFLDSLVPGWLAVVISVTLVLFVGEIIPASVMTGPKQLAIAATFTPLVYSVMAIFFVVAYPISMLLDYLVGHDEGVKIYDRKQLVTMVTIQHEEGIRRTAADGHDGMGNSDESGDVENPLHHGHGTSNRSVTRNRHRTIQSEEVVIVEGALKFSDMLVENVMTPRSRAFLLSAHDRLNTNTVANIFRSGFSRIPIYEADQNDVIGILLTKDLIFVDPEDDLTVGNFLRLFGRPPVVVWGDDKLGETMLKFRRDRSHIAIVRGVCADGPGDPYYTLLGILTLEDIVEEIIGAEIEDEMDERKMVQDGEVASLNKRDMDLARLQLLNTKIVRDQLTPEEVQTISDYLLTNVDEMKTLLGPLPAEEGLGILCQLVRSSPVLHLHKKSEDLHWPVHEDILYRHGRLTSSCTFILSGKVAMVTSDAAVLLAQSTPKRNLTVPSTSSTHQPAAATPATSQRLDTSEIVELEPWTAIATETLVELDGHFIPEFTAYLLSTVKLLIINIHSPEACAIAGLEKRKRELGIFAQRGNHRGFTMHSSHAPSLTDSLDGIRRSTSTTSILSASADRDDNDGEPNETATLPILDVIPDDSFIPSSILNPTSIDSSTS